MPHFLKSVIQIYILLYWMCGLLAQSSDNNSLRFKVAKAIKTKTAPVIDGILEPLIWKKAPIIDQFIQTEPVELGKASEQTISQILYDDKHIYVAITCRDSEPEEIKRKEEKETWEALTVVAKPNETHEANGFEFQYEFDEVGKPIYRRRKKGVDTWETLDPEAGGDQQDAYYAVSGVFGHTTIDGGLMMSQNQVISNASKKSQSLTNELVLESKTITDDASVAVSYTHLTLPTKA
mgnify:CR=1 FL=1